MKRDKCAIVRSAGCRCRLAGSCWRGSSEIAIRKGLVPEEVWLGRVCIISVGEEGSVLAVEVAIRGSDSSDIWVQFAGSFVSWLDSQCEVKRRLDRPAFGRRLVPKCIHSQIVTKASICLHAYKSIVVSAGLDTTLRYLQSWLPNYSIGSGTVYFDRILMATDRLAMYVRIGSCGYPPVLRLHRSDSYIFR